LIFYNIKIYKLIKSEQNMTLIYPHRIDFGCSDLCDVDLVLPLSKEPPAGDLYFELVDAARQERDRVGSRSLSGQDVGKGYSSGLR